MSYAVKEIYYTLQGNGAQTGRAAVFVRFSGCNLWSGREEDRATATCWFCDTDFVGTNGPGGGRFETAVALAQAAAAKWPVPLSAQTHPLVVCTGGEPLLQMDRSLVDALHDAGFEIAIETNGTRQPPPGIDWICVSPKRGAPVVLTAGNELKLIYPQPGLDPQQFEHLNFEQFFLQPMDDGPHTARNIQLAIQYCLEHPHWRLSLQMQKMVGLP